MAINFYTPKFFVFNNFSAHAVEFEGTLYPTSEHAYQATKCTDPKGKVAIRNARSPKEAKRLANEVYRAGKDPQWEDKKVAVMEAILRAKLTQHAEAGEALDESATEKIVEDSPVDYFWGEGANGSGQNMLGRLWMKIRAEQRANSVPQHERMTSLETANHYFELSNQSDFESISKLFTASTTYSSQNTGLFLGRDDIIAMQKAFHRQFSALEWHVNSVKEIKPGIVLFDFDFIAQMPNGKELKSSGLEYVILCDGKIQHIQVRDK